MAPPARFAEQERAGRRRDVGLPHQALADQEGADAGRRQPLDVGMGEDAAFGRRRCGRSGSAARAARDTASEVSKVRRSRLLTPIEPCVERQGALQLALVVDLDQHVHAEVRAPSRSSARASASVDARHDDQDAVGAPGARLDRPDRARTGSPCAGRAGREAVARRGQILGPALERGRVGQHREAGRAALRIGAGERRRIEIGADQALRGARLLDLGDQRRTAGGELTPRSRPRSRAGEGPRAPAARIASRRDRGLGGRDLPPLVGLDPGEDVAHAASAVRDGDKAVERRPGGAASRPPARRARRLRAGRRAASATTSAAAALRTAMSRYGVCAPSSTARSSAALWAGSPPLQVFGPRPCEADLLRRDRERRGSRRSPAPPHGSGRSW